MVKKQATVEYAVKGTSKEKGVSRGPHTPAIGMVDRGKTGALQF